MTPNDKHVIIFCAFLRYFTKQKLLGLVHWSQKYIPLTLFHVIHPSYGQKSNPLWSLGLGVHWTKEGKLNNNTNLDWGSLMKPSARSGLPTSLRNCSWLWPTNWPLTINLRQVSSSPDKTADLNINSEVLISRTLTLIKKWLANVLYVIVLQKQKQCTGSPRVPIVQQIPTKGGNF